MKKNLKYLVFLIPLIFFSSVNASVKANNKKNTVDKVTVVELEDKEYPTFSLIKKKSRTKTIGKISAYNFDRLKRVISSHKGNRYKSGVSVKADYSVIPFNYGKNSLVPHTTSTVKSTSRPKNSTAKHSITSSKPYIAVGKIFSVINNIRSECTATLIGKAVVVTAAECIAEWGGDNAVQVLFTPAATKSSGENGPLGMWVAKKLYIPACFTAGNCSYSEAGGIKDNNIALFTLRKQSGRTPSDMGGTYLNYGWNDPGFSLYSGMYAGLNKVAQITTLGYPTNLGDKSSNKGGAMIKTDSVAVSSVIEEENDLKFYLWGSGQPQASGSPVIVNFGFKPFYSNPSYEGEYSTPNVITGIQFEIENIFRKNQSGLASVFGQNISFPKSKYKDKSGRDWGAGNIGFLMRKVCGQGYGNGQSDGICLN